MNFIFDAKFDILYYTFEPSEDSYGQHQSDDIVFMRNVDTEDITGVTVMGFMRLYTHRRQSLSIIETMINIDEIVPECLKYKRFEITYTNTQIKPSSAGVTNIFAVDQEGAVDIFNCNIGYNVKITSIKSFEINW